VCSDARRGTWNVLRVATGGGLGAINRCSGEALREGDGPVFHPGTFPHWQALPEGARPVSYRPERLLDLIADVPLLRECTAPDAFMTELPTYRTWNPVSPSN